MKQKFPPLIFQAIKLQFCYFLKQPAFVDMLQNVVNESGKKK